MFSSSKHKYNLQRNGIRMKKKWRGIFVKTNRNIHRINPHGRWKLMLHEYFKIKKLNKIDDFIFISKLLFLLLFLLKTCRRRISTYGFIHVFSFQHRSTNYGLSCHIFSCFKSEEKYQTVKMQKNLQRQQPRKKWKIRDSLFPSKRKKV